MSTRKYPAPRAVPQRIYQLHEFVIAGRRYGIPDEEWPEAVPTLDERRFDVGAALAREVGEFTYTYDFGDGWQHAVKVEQAMFPNDLNIRPVCLAGQNACPPEDVGGAGGYIKFLVSDHSTPSFP